MLIPDVLGPAPGRLEHLLAVHAREGSAFGFFRYIWPYPCACNSYGCSPFSSSEIPPCIPHKRSSRHLPVLVAVPHMPLKAGVDVIRGATSQVGKGRLREVSDDDLQFLRCCCLLRVYCRPPGSSLGIPIVSRESCW